MCTLLLICDFQKRSLLPVYLYGNCIILQVYLFVNNIFTDKVNLISDNSCDTESLIMHGFIAMRRLLLSRAFEEAPMFGLGS